MSLQTPRNAVQSFGNRNRYEMALKCFSFFLEIQDPISETFQSFWKRMILFLKRFTIFGNAVSYL